MELHKTPHYHQSCRVRLAQAGVLAVGAPCLARDHTDVAGMGDRAGGGEEVKVNGKDGCSGFKQACQHHKAQLTPTRISCRRARSLGAACLHHQQRLSMKKKKLFFPHMQAAKRLPGDVMDHICGKLIHSVQLIGPNISPPGHERASKLGVDGGNEGPSCMLHLVLIQGRPQL